MNITSGPLAGTLEDDDLRGEGRWERLVTRGLLRSGWAIGSSAPKWGGDSGTPNWLGAMDDLSDAVYITIYGGYSTIPAGARAYILQFFSPPDATIENEIRAIMARAGHRNVFVTHSYPSDGCLARLPPDLADRGAWLPLPADHTCQNDAAEKFVLFCPSRNSIHDMTADGGEMLRWVRSALARDSRLSFECVSGTYESNSRTAILANPIFHAALGDVHHRITIHPPIGAPAVQAIYARTRLVVVPSGYGGPPLESARWGIPVIGAYRDCSLYSAPHTPGFPELPRVGADGSLAAILDRLLWNVEYARNVGNAGRKYVEQNFSAAAIDRAMCGIVARIA
jgi:hypothetical protein